MIDRDVDIDAIGMIITIDEFRFGKLNLSYHMSCSFKRGWVALGERLPVGLRLLWALGRLVCTGKGL